MTSFPIPDLIPHGHHAAHPHALLLGGGDLVPHPFGDHLAFELGEREQHVERKPAHAGGGVERLGDADEACPCAIQNLDDFGEVGEAAGEPVDLVDDDHIHPARLHLGEQPLEAGALHVAAREAAIVIEVGQQRPAFMALAVDIGGAGLTLGIEAVEILVEPLLGRFARVDGAADPASGSRLGITPHRRSPAFR
jgi:hypothetical protein